MLDSANTTSAHTRDPNPVAPVVKPGNAAPTPVTAAVPITRPIVQIAPTPAAVPASAHTVVNLLDWDDAPGPVAQVSTPAATVSSGAMFITPEVEIAAPRFQALWGQTPEVVNSKVYGQPRVCNANTQTIEAVLRQHKVCLSFIVHIITHTHYV